MTGILRMSTMRRQDHRRLCEWAELVGADLPEDIACDLENGSGTREERFQHDQ
jgi:hypothetical protein